jgi:hypothetical protein
MDNFLLHRWTINKIMNNKIVIKPLVKGSAGDTDMKVPSSIPNKNFMMSIVGMRGSGKSVLTSNLLHNYYLKEFDYVIILNPSADLNGDYKFIDSMSVEIRDRVHIFTKIKEFKDIITEVLQSQNDIIKGDCRENCPRTLIIMDDCLDSKIFSWGGVVEQIASRGRHSKLSCIIISQHMASISRKIRLNSDMLILFPSINMTEIEQFLLQYLYKRYHKSAMLEIERIFNIPYNFIVVNNGKKAGESKLYEQFDTPISISLDKKKKVEEKK